MVLVKYYKNAYLVYRPTGIVSLKSHHFFICHRLQKLVGFRVSLPKCFGCRDGLSKCETPSMLPRGHIISRNS